MTPELMHTESEIRDRFAEQKQREQDDAQGLLRAEERANARRDANLKSLYKADLIALVKDQRGQVQDLVNQLSRMQANLDSARLFGTQQTERLGAAEQRADEIFETIRKQGIELGSVIREREEVGRHADKLYAENRILETQLDDCKDKVDALLNALVLVTKTGER